MKKRKLMFRMILIGLAWIFLKCSSTRNIIDVQDHLIEKAYIENQHVFYLRYYETLTYWYIKNDSIRIFSMHKKELIKRQQEQYLNNIWFKNIKPPELFDLDTCKALGGSTLGFKLANNMSEVVIELPVNEICLRKTEFRSEFLNNLKKDLNNYEIFLRVFDPKKQSKMDLEKARD
ncbi:hypothetical protein HZR84_14270 [Hyphobacterium sp. CCMP332]|nr:hypothetical protein HZR84_14270 [Hyphobacterium sp. CCMP332]